MLILCIKSNKEGKRKPEPSSRDVDRVSGCALRGHRSRCSGPDWAGRGSVGWGCCQISGTCEAGSEVSSLSPSADPPLREDAARVPALGALLQMASPLTSNSEATHRWSESELAHQGGRPHFRPQTLAAEWEVSQGGVGRNRPFSRLQARGPQKRPQPPCILTGHGTSPT